MASGAGGGGSGSSGGGGSHGQSSSTTTKQMPRDAVVMRNLLKEMGVSHYEPRVINQMLDFVYRYVTNVVEEAKVYSTYAKKKTIDVEDVKLAVKITTSKAFTTVPPREMLMEIAKNKNSQPLPILKSTSGLRLPPDRFCLTQPNYNLEFYRKAIASSNKPQSATPTVRLPGTVAAMFKTPQNPRIISGPIPHVVQFAAGNMMMTPTMGSSLQTGVKRKLSDDF